MIDETFDLAVSDEAIRPPVQLSAKVTILSNFSMLQYSRYRSQRSLLEGKSISLSEKTRKSSSLERLHRDLIPIFDQLAVINNDTP